VYAAHHARSAESGTAKSGQMISYVSGRLVEKHMSRIVVDVGGVGYEIHVPASAYDRLPALDGAVKILTHHYVREDAATLFGFLDSESRTMFEAMLAVSGIGPRLALAALSTMTPGELRSSILAGDAGMLKRIPGVGRKTAERLVIELRDRVAPAGVVDVAGGVSGASMSEQSERLDALAALESLGFSRAAAEKLIGSVVREHPDLTTAEGLVKQALRQSR
jgi:Holliday junction DNA helicase RuvA